MAEKEYTCALPEEFPLKALASLVGTPEPIREMKVRCPACEGVFTFYVAILPAECPDCLCPWINSKFTKGLCMIVAEA
jgi:hypothetical protein